MNTPRYDELHPTFLTDRWLDNPLKRRMDHAYQRAHRYRRLAARKRKLKNEALALAYLAEIEYKKLRRLSRLHDIGKPPTIDRYGDRLCVL